MKVPKRKNVDWDLKRKRFKLKERIRRWWERYVRRQMIRSYIINEIESYVVKSISLKGMYKTTVDTAWKNDKDYVYAHKLIAMRYGLDMSVSDTRAAGVYSITLKKRQ